MYEFDLAAAARATSMIKSELVQHISASSPHLYPRDVERIVNAILGEIVAALAHGDRVELRGFGVFSVRDRPARIGCNPRSGAAVSVARRRMPLFKTSKEMRDRLNSGEKKQDIAVVAPAKANEPTGVVG